MKSCEKNKKYPHNHLLTSNLFLSLYSYRPLCQHAYIGFYSLAWAFCWSLVPSGPKCVSARSDRLNKQTNNHFELKVDNSQKQKIKMSPNLQNWITWDQKQAKTPQPTKLPMKWWPSWILQFSALGNLDFAFFFVLFLQNQLKGHWDNILNFSFCLNFIYPVKIDC